MVTLEMHILSCVWLIILKEAHLFHTPTPTPEQYSMLRRLAFVYQTYPPGQIQLTAAEKLD